MLIFGLKLGFVVGILVGLFFGGTTFIKQYLLHRQIAKSNYLPSSYWHFIPFFDHMHKSNLPVPNR